MIRLVKSKTGDLITFSSLSVLQPFCSPVLPATLVSIDFDPAAQFVFFV